MFIVRQISPSKQEKRMAHTSKQLLARYVEANQALTMQVVDTEQSDMIQLPAGAVVLLMEILEAMASGQSITLIPEQAELTTVQAAEILNVSRPFLIKLLDDEKIPCRKVGKHRRIRVDDVLNYKRSDDQRRETILDQLATDAQIENMGYE